jgi:hypothetical protein
MARNWSQDHLDGFFDKLRSEKKKLREIRHKRWKKQKMSIQREMEQDDLRLIQKRDNKIKEIKMRREQIMERLKSKKQRSL